jgi:hypothetical protein
MAPRGASPPPGARGALERLAERVRGSAALAWDASLAADARAALRPGCGSEEACAGAAAALLRRALTALSATEEPGAAALPAEALPHLAAAACCACDALQGAGGAALGARARPQELLLQRYALARKLVARGCHTAAAHQTAEVLRQLAGCAPSAHPPPPLDAPPGLGAPPPPADHLTLAVGAALCYAGAAAEGRSAAELLAALRVAQSLPPWLRREPPSSLDALLLSFSRALFERSLTGEEACGRHNDALFRYLCKARRSLLTQAASSPALCKPVCKPAPLTRLLSDLPGHGAILSDERMRGGLVRAARGRTVGRLPPSNGTRRDAVRSRSAAAPGRARLLRGRSARRRLRRVGRCDGGCGWCCKGWIRGWR